MKNIQDVKKEYGLVLRWINGGEADGIRQGSYLWLENINTGEKIYIVDNDEVLYKEAYELVKEVTHNGFRDKSSINCYDNYKKLFSIMDIAPIQTIDSLTNKTIAQLTRDSKLPRSTVDDILKGNTEFKNMSVKNAMRLGKALNMTIDELFGKIYTTRTFKSLERNGVFYEVEMLQTDEDGNITYANSWSNESEFFETYEEALKEAKEIRSETSKDSYDEVVVNEVEFVDDEAVDSSQKESFKVYGVMDVEQADYLDTLNDKKIISVVISAFGSIEFDLIKKYVNKGFNRLQLEQIFEGFDEGLSFNQVEKYAKNEYNSDIMYEIMYAQLDDLPEEEFNYIINLANNKYDSDILNAVRYAFGDYGLSIEQIDNYIDKGFDKFQLQEIIEGLSNGLSPDDVEKYADPKKFDWEMEEIRKKLEIEKKMKEINL